MKAMEERFLKAFGFLFPPAPKLAAGTRSTLDSLQYKTLAKGSVILREGSACSAVPFVLEGSIRVFKSAESGREITLYRIEAGESCILSSGCMRGNEAFPANVVAEGRTIAAFMPTDLVKRLLDESPPFRDFVLSQFSRRMAGVMELVEEIAFRHVDERLGEWLAAAGSAAARSSAGRVVATHQEIADHLGTSREVVSRILKDWEQRGALELSRGVILLSPRFGELHL